MGNYPPHVYLIPEDRRNEQLANGFVNHYKVDVRRLDVMPVAGGWSHVLKIFEDEYTQRLRENPSDHVVMLIDYDGNYDNRRKKFEDAIPDDLKQRVFVVGSKVTPEAMKKVMAKDYEQIGLLLADDCFDGTETTWSHDHLKHNDPDRLQMVNIIRPILFG